MKKANIVLDNQSTGLTIIEKMDFERIEAIFDALRFAFHPECDDGECNGPDDREMALWQLALACTGWTNDEFWEEWDIRMATCKKCADEAAKDTPTPDPKSN